MDITNDELSQLFLEYKQINDIDTPQAKVRKNTIFKYIQKKYQPLLFKKLQGVPIGDHPMVISSFNHAIIYSILKWKGKAPAGAYLALSFRAITREMLTERSPVSNQKFSRSVSYNTLAEALCEYEDNLDDDSKPYTKSFDDFIELYEEVVGVLGSEEQYEETDVNSNDRLCRVETINENYNWLFD